MNGSCLKCGTQLAPPGNFCPNCGAAAAREPKQETTQTPAEKAPVRGAFSGLLLGTLAAPILIIVGTLLCLTGLGAILGIPLIIGAIFAPLLGPMIGLGAMKGKCPWCAAPVSSVKSEQSFDCHSCNKRIAVRNWKFIRVE